MVLLADQEFPMAEDPRCCGSGTCIIDAEGRCWCGQQWNGHTMCRPPQMSQPPDGASAASDTSAEVPL
jgi:hypothetical protein